ncbi:GNAT family N-acetyltransferase [Prosthecobacter sp.]|uniref:GNAT family N-acetyltransferase n=1 Tax=Prosthecobacter sp. TaxID=1965333 RepID=UPI003782D7B0
MTATAVLSSRPRSITGNVMPAMRRGGLTLDLVRDEAGFYALRPYWDALVEQMATRTPFMRWDWMSLWWEECRRDAQLAIAVLRDAEGLPQAIAPLMLACEQEHARQHLVTLTFLGGFGDAHGERLDLIVPAGRENELTPQLCQVFKQLRDECDNVRLNHLPEESPNTRHILAALTESYTCAGILNRQTCRFIHLPASWEEYEVRHHSNWRNLMRRRRRAFASLPENHSTHAGERLPPTAAMAQLRQLHAMQWPEGVSSFTTDSSWRFHQRLAARWLPQERAVMPMLEADGRVIAALYGFIERDEFFQYQTGWDKSHAGMSPGKLVMRWAVEGSIQRKLRVHDMLPSDYEYKRQWCDGARWLLDLEAFNPASWRATVFHALRTVRRWLPHHTSTATTTPSHELQEAQEPALRPAA